MAQAGPWQLAFTKHGTANGCTDSLVMTLWHMWLYSLFNMACRKQWLVAFNASAALKTAVCVESPTATDSVLGATHQRFTAPSDPIKHNTVNSRLRPSGTGLSPAFAEMTQPGWHSQAATSLKCRHIWTCLCTTVGKLLATQQACSSSSTSHK